MKKKFNAFTLAEVLIVLVILGVISALTVPNLLGTAGEKRIVTGFKKGFAGLNQAINMASVEFGRSPGSMYRSENSDDSNSLVGMFADVMKVSEVYDNGFTTQDGISYYFERNDAPGTCASLGGGTPNKGTACYIGLIDGDGYKSGSASVTEQATKGKISDRFTVYVYDDGVFLGSSAAGDVFADNIQSPGAADRTYDTTALNDSSENKALSDDMSAAFAAGALDEAGRCTSRKDSGGSACKYTAASGTTPAKCEPNAGNTGCS